MVLNLYSYFRSSASFRVRIALNIKSLPYKVVPVHLLRNGGEQHYSEFSKRNPLHLLPVIEHGTVTLSQSLTIIEYLEELYPTPALLPGDAAARARIRALALTIACDIHPLNNLRVLQYLKSPLAIDEKMRTEWSHYWITLGFEAIERILSENSSTGGFCYGDTPTVADCCLVPQVVNAQRVGCSLDRFENIMRIYEHCMRVEAFQRASPGSQVDAE